MWIKIDLLEKKAEAASFFGPVKLFPVFDDVNVGSRKGDIAFAASLVVDADLRGVQAVRGLQDRAPAVSVPDLAAEARDALVEQAILFGPAHLALRVVVRGRP